MGWRDFQTTTHVDFMDNMDFMPVSVPENPEPPHVDNMDFMDFIPKATPLNPYCPYNPHTPAPEKGTVPAVPPSDWRPEFKAWLEGDSLRTTGVTEDLAGVIVGLTKDNLPLQKKLLTAYCGIFNSPCWQSLADRFIARAAEIFDKEGVDHRTAMYRAAEEMHLLAFEKELDIKFHSPVEQDTPPF